MAVSHIFRCTRCPNEAGRVTIYAPGEAIPSGRTGETDQVMAMMANTGAGRARLEVLSSLANSTVFEFDLGSVLAAVGGGDARSLYDLNLEYVPFWCPPCDASYGARHWMTWDTFDEGFFDQKRGRCPVGHERMLMD